MWDAWYAALALSGAGEHRAAADVLARVRARERGLALRMALRVRELDAARSGAGTTGRPQGGS
jgi:hypothetical protein